MAQISCRARIAIVLTAASVASTVALVGPAPASAQAARDVNWDAIAQCESGGNWRINTGNGYHGGLQFNPRTWRAYGGGKYGRTANQASRAEQIRIAERVLDGQGIGAWPTCGRKARSTKRFTARNTTGSATRKSTAQRQTSQRQTSQRQTSRSTAVRKAAARKAAVQRAAARNAARVAEARATARGAATRETTARAASRAAERRSSAARTAAARAVAVSATTMWAPATALRLTAARKAAALDAAASSPTLHIAALQAAALQAAAALPRTQRATDGPQLAAHVTAADRQPAQTAPAGKPDGPQLTAHAVEEPTAQ
jgi:hypothetical protein